MGVRVVEGTVFMKRCAFCSKWYDPMNTAIKPVAKRMWDYDTNIRKRCTEKGIEKKAGECCSNFCSKI